ncbi:ThuA domain-containing protein [Microbacterium sp. NPDC019599]|uniref:ThuA domain-containing protein n=1 Tax=Microbacterium sp. NPDC019599 TaxID=3154690 RepID=UPI0033DB997C
MLLTAALVTTGLAMPLAAAAVEEEPLPKVLVFSKTAAFRHSSIPAGAAAIEALGTQIGVDVDLTEDAAQFTPANLDNYEAVVFLSTTGDVLNATQQTAFEDYIAAGGGYAGIHAASDTEYTWPWYGGLVGAYFANHPAVQQGHVQVADKTHPSTTELPTDWVRTDEWYNYQTNPRGKVHVLATLDETTYTGGAMGQDHPIAWCQYYKGGRSWYTGGGHAAEAFAEPLFMKHLAGGLLWAAGLAKDDCGGTVDKNFQKVVLDDDVASPMGLQVAPDGRVLYIERSGLVRSIDPATSVTSTVGRLQVYTAQENGLLGIELDPDFATNGWIYLYYSPANANITEPHQRLSRFTVVNGTLDMASEKIILRIPHQRVECCHSGGHLDFDGQGNLWISVGDDSSPGGAPGGYSPIDERPGQEPMDAQRSSGNTNDLRGKLLRITPTDEGGYVVPSGNLIDTPWATGQDKTKIKPEIYGMGLRNPFRFSVDDRTGAVYLADYGPDAAVADANKGIDGRVEWNNITEPGNYGWPYCHGGGAYRDYNYATNTAGAVFDCNNLVNDSPNNTGLRNLPPVIQPDVSYGRLLADPVIGRGGAPMGGPAYVYDPTIESDRQWPDYFDGTPLFYEWGQNKIYEFHLDDAGELDDITPLLTSLPLKRPHDMQFGRHDGALYVIEWGSGFGGDNPDSQIVRIDYTGGSENPVASASADIRSGGVPLQVKFSSAGSSHPQGGEITYAWDFGDGTTSTQPNPSHTYMGEGNFTARLVVTDTQGRTGTDNVRISAGNTEPDVKVTWPASGTVFSFGDKVDFKVGVEDAEDGTTSGGGIDCADVTAELILAHDDHGHPMQDAAGCTGSFVLQPDSGHTDLDRISYALEARYRDQGSPEGTVEPLTGREVVVLQPARKQVEHREGMAQGVRVETSNDPLGGGSTVGFITDGTWMQFDDFNFANIDSIKFRSAAPNGNGRIEIRKNSVDGPILGSKAVTSTGSFANWGYTEIEVDDPGETFDLFLVFRGPTGYLFNLNWMDFVGTGAAGGQPPVIAAPTATVNPAAPTGSNEWYVDPVKVTLNATAGDSIQYRVNGSGWASYTGPVTIDAAGTNLVEYRATRGAFHSPRGSVTLNIDATAPATTNSLQAVAQNGSFTGAVGVTLAATDATSGIARTEYRVDGGAVTTYTQPFVVTGASDHTVLYRSVDKAGLAEDWKTVRFHSPQGTQPVLTVSKPEPGGIAPIGTSVPFVASVTGGQVDCRDVRARIVVTDGGHRHEGESRFGCTGAVPMVLPTGHTDLDKLIYTLEVTYSQGGFDESIISLARATSSLPLQPSRIQAEHYDTDATIRTETAADTLGGGLNVGFLRAGATLKYSNVNFEGISAVRFRLASNSVGGTLEIRKDTATGPVLGSVAVTSSGAWTTYKYVDAPVTDPGGPFTMVLVFQATGTHYIANLNWIDFVGSGFSATVPTAPQNTAVTATGRNATVTWAAPSSNGGAPLTGYVVYREGTSIPLGTVGASVTSFEVTTLPPGQYRFTVAALNAVGEGPKGGLTNQVTLTATAPTAPQGVTASAAGTKATVSWAVPASDGGSALTGYVVYREGTTVPLGTVGSSETSFEVTTLPAGQYRFAVAAVNGVGEGPKSGLSNQVAVTSVPTAPQGVTASAAGAKATVSWAAPDSDGGSALTGYVVYREGTTVPLGTVGPSVTSFEVTTLPPGQYRFAVAAVNGVGEGPKSGLSNQVAVTPADTVAPVVSAVSSPAAADGANGWFVSPVSVSVSASDADSGIASVEYRLGDGAWSAYSSAVSIPEGTTTFIYRATDKAGNVSEAKQLQVKIDLTAPVVTGSLQARSAAVSASDAGSGVASVEYQLDAGAWTAYTEPVAAPDAAAHMVYFRAKDAAGQVSTTGVVSIPAAPPAGRVPGAPTGVTVALGDAVAKLTWVAPADPGSSAITGYTVTAVPGGKTCTTTGALTCRVEGLTNGTAYSFVVTASNAVGTSVASAATYPATPSYAPGTAGNVSVSVNAKAQCVNGKPSLAVYVLNKESVTVTAAVTTAYGTQSVTLAAGKAAYLTFTTTGTSMPADTASIVATKTVNGAPVSTTYQAGYTTITCN